MFAGQMHSTIQATAMPTTARHYSDLQAAAYDRPDCAAFHIYNEPQEPPSAPASASNAVAIAIPPAAANGQPLIYGFRTRHLSCIEENDSDSLHSSSVGPPGPPPPYELMQQVDEDFKRLQAASEDPSNSCNCWPEERYSEDDDEGGEGGEEMAMLDESRLYDLEYLDELSASKASGEPQSARDQDEDGDVEPQQEQYWRSSISEPLHRGATYGCGRQTDLMTTSCYGALNTTCGSDVSDHAAAPHAETFTSTPKKQQQQTPKQQQHPLQQQQQPPQQQQLQQHPPQQQQLQQHPPQQQQQQPALQPQQQQQREPIYATPEKRRDFNRSFDSSCPSQCSSIHSGLEANYNAMTTSLDLKCMTASAIGGGLSTPLDLSAEGMQIIEWPPGQQGGGGGKENAADDLNEEMARQCIHAAENAETIYSVTNSIVCCIRCIESSRSRISSSSFSMSSSKDQNSWSGNKTTGRRSGSGFSCSFLDLQSIRRLLEHEKKSSDSVCPSCRISFDKGKRRKLIDTCGHERCYACMFRNDQCPMCMNSSLKDVDCNNTQGYDTGIGGSTSTIVSPLGSPQPQLRSQVQQRTNAAALAKFMQYQRPESLSPEFRFAGNSRASKASTPQTPMTVTVDVHHNQLNPNANTSQFNHNYSEINAAAFATPPTRRRFFNHQKLRSALTGHRRTASNGTIDTSSILSAGSDHISTAEPAAYSTTDNKKDQLRARLGLLLDTDQNGPPSTTNSSTNVSPEQTLSNGHGAASAADKFGSQLSVTTKEDNVSLSGKFKACSLADSNGGDGHESFPIKARKAPARRSARTGQLVGASKRTGGVYKSAGVQLALKPLFFEVPLQEPDPPFVGRQWLLRELSNVLTATETPGVLINGHPGSGKTTLVLQLVEYSCFGRRRDAANAANVEAIDGIYCQINVGHDRLRALASHVVGYHFCQADANLTCLVPDFVHSLAAQLCQAPQLSAYREYLINEPHLQDILCVKECIADAERVMRMAILEPLTILKRAGKISAKTCVILVDALCEAEYHRPDQGHTIATFLAKMTQFFPTWLKVVATVRTQMLEFVKGLSYTKMTLDSWASNDLLQKDMLDYITFRVNHSVDIQNNIAASKEKSSGQLKFVGHLQTLCRGSMLFAKLTLDLIERGQLVIKSTSYKVLPVSLAQIFLLHFNLRFPTASSFERAAPILNVCLAALYPLTLSEIYYTVCALKTDDLLTWDEFLQRFQLLDGFLIKRIDNTYMFFHPSFREWLIRREEGESPKFVCDPRIGHAAIAFRMSRMQAPLDPEQTLELGHHMLKAHIYRQCQGLQSPRDLQSFWIASVTDSISAALGSLRNLYNPNLKVSRLMLLAGACPHHQTEFLGGATILCISAHEGIVPMVSLLLEFGADVERTNSQGCTPLILAAMRGHCDVVRLLVAAGSSLGQTDTTQRCALVHAARMGHLSVVKYLLACDWTPRPESNDVTLKCALQQALIGAAAQNHVTILEDLLEMDDIEINTLEEASGDMALTAAARNGCTDAAAVLLTRGACVDAHNKHGFTPLGLAVKEGHWAVVEKLLQSGADANKAALPTKKTPLMIAAEEGHTELMEQLIQHGANLEAQDHEGFTALSWACLRGRQVAAKCLIERGCNKNHADNNGRTALDLAAYQGSAALVLYLLDQGANLEHIDVNGMRPLDRSIACRNIQVVQVFLRRGAKLGPTTWSMAMGKPEIQVVLLNKLLEDGNVLYRKGRFQEAAHRYQYALRKIANLENLLERSAVFAQLRVNLLLNLSRCKRKLNELEESIDLASQAIDQKPSSYEGFYARAKARMEDGQLNAALVDTNEAMQKAVASGVQPEVIEVLKRIQAELLARISNECGQQQQQFSGGAGGASLVSGSQNEITDL